MATTNRRMAKRLYRILTQLLRSKISTSGLKKLERYKLCTVEVSWLPLYSWLDAWRVMPGNGTIRSSLLLSRGLNGNKIPSMLFRIKSKFLPELLRLSKERKCQWKYNDVLFRKKYTFNTLRTGTDTYDSVHRQWHTKRLNYWENFWRLLTWIQLKFRPRLPRHHNIRKNRKAEDIITIHDLLRKIIITIMVAGIRRKLLNQSRMNSLNRAT